MPYVIRPNGSCQWKDPSEEYQLQAGESFADETPPLAPLTGNALLDSQIRDLEVIQEAKLTPRARRELFLGIIMALGLDPSLNPGTAELANIQARIVALRSQRT